LLIYQNTIETCQVGEQLHGCLSLTFSVESSRAEPDLDFFFDIGFRFGGGAVLVKSLAISLRSMMLTEANLASCCESRARIAVSGLASRIYCRQIK